MLETQDKQMTEDEIDELFAQIFEAEERGDVREAEILRTKIPFDDRYISFFKGICSEEAYTEYLTEIIEYRKTKNQAILKKYSIA